MYKLFKLIPLKLKSESSLLIVIIPVILSAFVHSTILGYDFKFDDYMRFYDVNNLNFTEYILKPNGGHLLSTFNLMIFVLFKIFGLNASIYFSIVLLTHLASVIILFLIIKDLIGRPYIAVFGSALWGISPINQGSLGWISVYGHVFSTLCIMVVFYDIIRIKTELINYKSSMNIRWYLLLFAAATSFGTGFAIAALFPLFAWLLLKGNKEHGRIIRNIAPLMILMPLFYFISNAAYTHLSGIPTDINLPEIINPSASFPMIKMFIYFICYAIINLLMGPYIIYGNGSVIFSPLKWLSLAHLLNLSIIVSAVFMIIIFYTFIKSSNERRRQILAFSGLTFITFGIIAVGRVGLISILKVPLLSFVVSPRYYYFGLIPLAMLLCFAIDRIIENEITGKAKIYLCLFIWLAVLIQPDRETGKQVEWYHGIESSIEYKKEVTEIRKEIHKHPVETDVYLINKRLSSILLVLDDGTAFPNLAAFFIITFPENIVEGRRIFFIENDSKLAEKLRKRKNERISSLIVSPDVVSKNIL